MAYQKLMRFIALKTINITEITKKDLNNLSFLLTGFEFLSDFYSEACFRSLQGSNISGSLL